MSDIVDRLTGEKCDYDTRCYAASEIAILRLEKQKLRAALGGVLKAGVYNDACECVSCEMARAALVQSAATEDSDPPCTCCGGTGVTYQTERRCACQPAAQGDAND